MADNSELHLAWKEANSEVRAAEDRLHAAWQAFANGQSGPPDKALLTEVSELRRKCDERLTAVLERFAGGSPNVPSKS